MGKRIFGFVFAGVIAANWLAAGATASSAKTIWLCRPGASPDPCTPGLSTTVYTPSFKKIGVEHPRAVAHPRIDCFYVYPTVSTQKTGNANLSVDPQERSIALFQAARYSQYCRVFAPMYRQVTIVGLGNPAFGHPTTTANSALAYRDVQRGFETYLEKYNHGRGFILIGHSQGSLVLRKLIAQDVDPKPDVRRRLVSAILLGGNVVVKKGKTIGGDFKHIPGCRSRTQLECVIAFSTFDQTPPSGSPFGHPGNGGPDNPRLQVLCTSPAALAGGSGLLDPIFPSAPFASGSLFWTGIALNDDTPTPPTVWWSAPGSYRASCTSSNGATVLEVTPLRGAPLPTPSPLATWGLHLLDANIALGNLISIVKAEAVTFAARRR